jgi:DNA-binding NarL/FixJ family response regulator
MERVRITLVEDDPGVVKRFARAIEAAPDLELACAAATVRAALDWLRTQRPDVLLVDLGLPDGSGLDVIRYAAGRYPDCDIMVISIFGDEAKVLESIEAGASGYLLKDGSESELPRHIQDLRAGGAPMSPVIARTILRRLKPAGPAPASKIEPLAEPLTAREGEILSLIARGYSYSEIAERTGSAVNTVKTHIKRIYGKLSVTSRGEAVYEASRRGMLPPGMLG